MSELDAFAVHTVQVATVTGPTGLGQTAAAPLDVQCLVDERRRIVRDGTGAQVVSEATVYVPDVTKAAAFAPGSTVTLPSGRTATVITVNARTAPGLGLPEHVEVTLT